jgi:cytosine/adenosine deaminase-related metal-dependent hydrolase
MCEMRERVRSASSSPLAYSNSAPRGRPLNGIDEVVGQHNPGNRADSITGTTRALNRGGCADPAHLLIGSAFPENVDTVVIDGRILKRDGKLTALSGSQVVADARASLEAIRKRANWR